MELKQHVIDTLKEWQMKIGFQEENVKLYYPISSLYDYFNLDKNCDFSELKTKFTNYITEQMDFLGEIRVKWEEMRVCIEVSAQGGRYIYENVKEPYLLKAFLHLLNEKSTTISDVENLFNAYAKKYNGTCYIEKSKHNESRIFYFSDNVPENYVYCIENDEFGITYHRFSKDDYNREQRVLRDYK